MNYLGIIIDDKFIFSQHKSHADAKCTKHIYSLSNSAKVSWEHKNEALKTIYKERYYFSFCMEHQFGEKH